MRRYIMLMMMLPCLAMAQTQAGLYRLMAGTVKGVDNDTVPTDGLVAHWPLTTDSTTNDIIGASDLTFFGTATISDNSLYIDDVDKYSYAWVDSESETKITGNQTWCIWMKLMTFRSSATIFSRGFLATSTASRHSFSLEFGASNEVRFDVGGGSSYSFFNSDYAVPIGEWVHFAKQYDGSSLSFYVNGNLVISTNVSQSTVYTTPTDVSGTSHLRIGGMLLPNIASGYSVAEAYYGDAMIYSNATVSVNSIYNAQRSRYE